MNLVSDPIERVRLKWIEDVSRPIDNVLDMTNNKSVIHRSEFTPSLFNIKIGEKENYTKVWFGESYSFLSIEFIFERTITANILTVYIPSSLVVTLSWIQFWFDVEAVPGRMSLGIMSTLTIMTQILTNYEKAANHVTAVDIWLLVCMIMVFLALMEYAVAYTISHYHDIDGNLRAKNSFKKNLSLIVREMRHNKLKTHRRSKDGDHNLFRKVVTEKVMNDGKESKESKESKEIKDYEDKIKSLPELVEIIQTMNKSFIELNRKLEAKTECSRHLNLVDYISRYAFPLVFVMFALIYWFLLIYFYDSS